MLPGVAQESPQHLTASPAVAHSSGQRSPAICLFQTLPPHAVRRLLHPTNRSDKEQEYCLDGGDTYLIIGILASCVRARTHFLSGDHARADISCITKHTTPPPLFQVPFFFNFECR